MTRLFSFPNPVNEKAARVVAGVVLLTVLVILATGANWLLIPLAYGFWARVLTGPTLSPLGWTAQNVIAPRLGPKKPVPGPPKRFAQGMGAAMATLALVFWLIVGSDTATDVVLGLFVDRRRARVDLRRLPRLPGVRLLMRIGLVPESVCARVRRHQRAPPRRPRRAPRPEQASREPERGSPQDVVLGDLDWSSPNSSSVTSRMIAPATIVGARSG